MFREQETITATRARLQKHAEEAGGKPPVHLLADDGAPSSEVLAYCDRHSLTLDWVYLGAQPKHRIKSNALPSPAPMKRQDMQDLASEVQSLIGAAITTWDSEDNEDALSILEMAHRRARTLNTALDIINASEGEAA